MRDLQDYYSKYIEDNFDHILSDYKRQYVEAEILKRLKPKYIVEVGCGINPLFFHFEDFEKHTIIEPAEGFCRFVNEKLDREYAHLKGKITVIEKTIQEAEELINEPDFIVCSGLLGEIPEPLDVIESMYKICGKHTKVYLSAPNENSFHRVLAKEAGLIKDLNQLSEEQIKFQRFHVFSRETLMNMASKAGFKTVESGTYFVKPFTHKQMNFMIKEKQINMDVILGLGKMIKYMPEMGAEVYVCLEKK